MIPSSRARSEAEPQAANQPTIAFLPWGNSLEDWLEPLGVSLEALRTEFSASWLFRYIGALRRAGIRSVVIAPSRTVVRESSFTHQPTGATFALIPSPFLFRVLRRTAIGTGLSGQYVREVLEDRRTVLRAGGAYLAMSMRGVIRALRHHGCDAILCHEYEYPRFDQAILLGRLLGIPVFATFQGGTATSLLERPWRRTTIRRSAGLIIPSRLELERVRRRYGTPPPPIAHILNPVDLETWRPGNREAARTSLGLRAEARVVAWHGQVELLRKGLDILLDAWASLRRRRSDAELILLLLGTGPDAAALRRLIAERRLDGVRWNDAYIHDPLEIRRHLWAADVFAFPSRKEGLPLAPMEAMASGLPLVAADVPGAADLLERGDGSGGKLVPAADPEAFAEELERFLFDDDARRAAADDARRTIEAAASFESVSRRLADFLFENGLRGRWH
jgi:glycosyltransferase involved in cell wall biosynthesis